jgi:hypothetical protein
MDGWNRCGFDQRLVFVSLLFGFVVDDNIDIPTCEALLRTIERETEDIIGELGGMVQANARL